jgi:hypothetical protein
MMTNAESLNLIFAIASVIATGVSAYAACRSARSAHTASKTLNEERIRFGKQAVADLVASCATTYMRIKYLANKISIVNRENAIFNGQYGGSRQNLVENDVTKCLEMAEESFKSASNFRDNPLAIGRLIQEDIERLQINLTLCASELRTVEEKLVRDFASDQALMLQNRERVLSNI